MDSPQIRRCGIIVGIPNCTCRIWGDARKTEGLMPRKKRRNPTLAERKLWSRICDEQLRVKFRRQHAVGNFIPDFVCIEKKLIIELDGSQHLEQKEYDEERTKFLETEGYKVIRFWNNDVVKNMDGVILSIMYSLESGSE